MIYIVEDDIGIRELMIYTLQVAGYQAKGMGSSEELEAMLEKEVPDLLLLDLMLPGKDGLTIVRECRQNSATAALPIIITTAKGQEYDKILGLDTGADDYLVKPFGMMEMVSRVKAVLRRCHSVLHQPLLQAGALRLDRDQVTVTMDGHPLALTRKEYLLLENFMEHIGQIFTREQLLRQIWQEDAIPQTRTVDVHIRMLRGKLTGSGVRIITVRQVGYRMEILP